MTPALKTIFINLHRAEFDNSDWWTADKMLQDLKEIDEPDLREYVAELEADLETDRLNNEAKAGGYRQHEASEI
jgi:hypothetical protein